MFGSPQTVLGFDFGTKRIGVAVGQTLTKTAKPLHILAAQNGVPTWANITQLLNEWQPQALVVGIPLNMDGTEQPITHAALRFSEQLAIFSQLPVHKVDERLTTVDARAHIFATKGYKGLHKARVDSTAAQLILEDWLAQYGRGLV